MKKIIYILTIVLLYLPVARSQGIANNGSYIKISQGAIIKVTGNKGNFVNEKSGALNGKIQNDGKIYVQGKWENNSPLGNVFSNRNGIGEVEFNGTAMQAIGGSQMTYFENLSINNSSGVTLGADEWIDTDLKLKNGIITTSTNKVIVANTNTNAINLHSVTNYINGNLRKYVSGGKQYDLPVGTAAQYELATVNISTLGLLSYVDASFSNVSPGTVPVGLNVNGTPISEFLDYGYWRIVPDNDLNTVYDITVTSRGHTNGATVATAHALFYRSNGGIWQNFGVHDNATQSGTGTNPVTAKRTNASNIFEYAIGKSKDIPLPVELLNFMASCNENHTVNISWATSSETNNDYFTVNKSADAVTWIELSNISGAGNSNQTINYSFTDNDYRGNIAYYQLKQTDYNGNATLFNISSANCYATVETSVSVYPNPFSTYATIEINDASPDNIYVLRIYNALGTEVMNTIITDQNTTLETSNFTTGLYSYIVYKNGTNILSGKLVSQQ